MEGNIKVLSATQDIVSLSQVEYWKQSNLHSEKMKCKSIAQAYPAQTNSRLLPILRFTFTSFASVYSICRWASVIWELRKLRERWATVRNWSCQRLCHEHDQPNEILDDGKWNATTAASYRALQCNVRWRLPYWLQPCMLQHV